MFFWSASKVDLKECDHLVEGSTSHGIYRVRFFDVLTDDKKQDGFAVLALLGSVFVSFPRLLSPRILAAGFDMNADGAGCFKGTYWVLVCAKFWDWYGVRIRSINFGEAQKNKSRPVLKG